MSFINKDFTRWKPSHKCEALINNISQSNNNYQENVIKYKKILELYHSIRIITNPNKILNSGKPQRNIYQFWLGNISIKAYTVFQFHNCSSRQILEKLKFNVVIRTQKRCCHFDRPRWVFQLSISRFQPRDHGCFPILFDSLTVHCTGTCETKHLTKSIPNYTWLFNFQLWHLLL